VESHLSAVILAAGLSSRMGELKATLDLGGESVLDRCICLFRQCGIEDLVVVTGHRQAEIGRVAEGAGARTAYNPDFASGMYSSIQTGVRHLVGGCTGFFLLPVDIPMVRSGTIRLLVESFTEQSSLISYPIFMGKRGHPPLIAGSLIPVILGSEAPAGGLRALLAAVEKHQREKVVDVEVADANIHFDMDTPEDYAVGCRHFQHIGYPTMAETQVILKLHPMQEKGLAHGRLVGRTARILCLALRQKGRDDLDLDLCEVGGLLHDIAKGYREHEQEGARWLASLGFDRVAEIIAAHKDLSWNKTMRIGEKELVHLADKLVRGGRFVGIAERFEEKLKLYRDKPEAVAGIDRRYKLARRLAATFESETGRRLSDILAGSASPCNP